jgi:hypothetical protein
MATSQDKLPEIFKLNRLRYDQMMFDVKSYLGQRFAQVGQVFSPASAFGQILTVMLDLGKLIFYYVEDSLTETNIYTATRDNSIRSLASLTGHNPTRSIAATGTVRLTYNGNSVPMYGNTLIIPNYTALVNEDNGFTYTIVSDTEEIRLNLIGKSSVEVRVMQGIIEPQEFTGSGWEMQSFQVIPRRGAQIDHFFVKVYVNGTEWKQYDSIYDMPYEGEAVMVRTGMSGGLDIVFGNGYFGRKPVAGATIRVEYLTTAGNDGNLVDGAPPNLTFSDSVYDVTGTPVDGNEIIDFSVGVPIMFGADPEPLELTRVLAPRNSRAFVLINADSYVYFLQKFNLFSVIDAFSTLEDDNVEDDNVIYLFLIPDVNKRKPNSADYFSTPFNLFLLQDYEKEKVYDYIEESGQKIMNTVIKIVDPIVKRYILNINVTAYEGFSKDTIRQQIVSKCSDYFLKNRRRDRIPKSDLVSIIESVEGVDSVNLWFVSEENEVFKTDPANASQPDKGIDAFGDIITSRGEYALVRGGWKDRNGVMYYDTVDASKPGSVNIAFAKDTQKTLNMELHRINIDSIKNS